MPKGSLDFEDIENCVLVQGTYHDEPTNMRALKKKSAKSSNSAKAVRDRFCKYFNGVGAVSWQKNLCNYH